MLVEIDIHISIRIHGYDNWGQLLTESGTVSGFPEAPYSYSNAYQYDSVGNIKSFSDGTTTHTYAYEDADWKDLLTSYDGQSITYDSNGNPTSYFNGNRWTFGWENGRQLTTLSKQAPVIITTQPENFFGTAGSTATFTVKAEGDRVTYQWQRSKDEGKTWTDISDETSETLNVTIQSSDFGSQYRCIAKDFMGHVATSQAGKLASSIASQSAWDPEYTVINEPDDYYGRPGDIATFIVEAEGKNLSYQWLYQAPGSDEFVYCTSSDATTNTLRVEMTAESDGAQYRCFITDANGDMGSTRCATVKLDVRDWTMEYEAGGLRTKRSSAEKTYNYIYSGDKLVRMTCGDNILDFTFDANGAPLTLVTGGKVYYYLTNLQGDVMSIESSDGTPVASYCYDAWGKILACDGALAELNPLRYRGYVYDQETGFYYLQSRYYDPAIGRFINADNVISYAGNSLLGCNVFAYCFNNPVNLSDDSAHWPKLSPKTVLSALSTLVKVAVTVAVSIKSAISTSRKTANTVNSSLPNKGNPGSSVVLPNPDGTPKQKRWYGPDGSPVRDRDYNHPGNMPFPHDHEWKNGQRGKEHLPPDPAYEFSWTPVVGIGLMSICAIGFAVVAADNVTGIGVVDDVLFGPLGTGFAEGVIIIFK